MPQRSILSDFVSRLVAAMLPVSYFLVTVSFYLKTYDSAQIKITLTQIGLSLLAVLWVSQLLLEKRWPFRREDLFLAAPFLAVLASGILSWSRSEFPGGSFDEGLRRVLYSFSGLIALSEFRGQDRQRRLLRWLVAAFAVVVAYGVIQYLDTRLFPPGAPELGLDKFVWRQAFGARVFSTFGNPNFYGNFLVIITPILLVLYFKDGGQVFRPYLLMPILVGVVVLADKLWLGSFGGVPGDLRLWAGLGLAALALATAALVFWRTPTGASAGMLLFFGAMFVNLYSTETKGAWVGFVGAIVATSVLTGLFLMGEGARRVTRRLLIAAGLTALLGMGVVGYYARQRVQSVSFRVFTWISTWEMIREHPVLGAGIGTFKYTYPAYRRPEIILLEAKSNTETDHAEEEYLETWSDEGMVGFGIFLWMILSVSVAGLKTLRRLTAGAGPPSGIEGERVYSLVAYMGAWWAALLHWTMDVSVRFVSSGIYSLLLPALVSGLSREKTPVARQDDPSPMDRWVRLTVAGFWTGIFLCLPRYYSDQSLIIQFWPALLMGALLWSLGEVLEIRLSSEKSASKAPAPFHRVPLVSLSLGLLLLALWGRWMFPPFRNFFKADLDHNAGIFFSRSGIWSKGPEFDGAAAGLPPEMQEEYARVGGALEHYQEVDRLNPYFPMASYFIGNVYNDWGSAILSRGLEARSQGRKEEAGKLIDGAISDWNSAEKAYDRLKAFAPNYVQTHHEVGLLYLKRMEMDNALGDAAKARQDGDKALENFGKYQLLDPVFPPNYYCMARVHSLRGEWEKAAEDYRGALAYNTANVVHRLYPDRNLETNVDLGRLLLTQLEQEPSKNGRFDPANPLFEGSVKAFESALGSFRDLGESSDYLRFAEDAHKGLGLLYLRAGDKARATEHWGWVMSVDPKDPDLLRVTQRK